MLTTDLIPVLESRGIRLYHANYPADVREYARQGGVCSRAVLSSIPGMTDFGTDDRDKRLGLLHKVTLNSMDMGFPFGQGEDLPNPYGPVLFVFSPQAILYADQCEVLLTSRYDQPSQARVTMAGRMNTSHEVENFLEKNSTRTAWGHTLREADMNLEVVLDCSVLPFDALQHIIVDPIEIEGFSLFEWVRERLPEYPVVVRSVNETARGLLDGLLDCAIDSDTSSQGKPSPPMRESKSLSKQERLRFLLEEYTTMLRDVRGQKRT